MNDSTYVLITAARNEEAYIEKTIHSIISQSILPKRWVIISDNSTDRTDEIVKSYSEKHDFIHFSRIEFDRKRSFASKAWAIQKGCTFLENLEYSYIGNVDADVSFDSDYYLNIIRQFHQNSRLGIAGGVICDFINGKSVPQVTSSDWSVSGATQLFKRECFQQITGYIPLPYGGIDALAETMARKIGWHVQSFPEHKVLHHRRTGTELEHILKARFSQGLMEFSHGYYSLFEIMKCIYRLKERPYIIGSLFRMSGYLYAFLRGNQIAFPEDVVQYLRAEQKQKLLSTFSKLIKISRLFSH